jgi:hypothetical protein
MRQFLLLLACPLAIAAQGLPAGWEIEEMTNTVIGHAQRLAPLLEKAQPQWWIEQGAPAIYAEQYKSAVSEVGYTEQTAQELGSRPQRLAKALELYLRMQAMEATVTSIADVIERRQNEALAAEIRAVLSEAAPQRFRLREYLTELASTQEDQIEIMDGEAQRCRANLIEARPASAPKRPASKR